MSDKRLLAIVIALAIAVLFKHGIGSAALGMVVG